MNPKFLTLAEAIEVHRDQITRYGGATGIRDLGLLKSALGMPSTMFGGEFLHADPIEMAAAYLFHIVKNHPFVDGNKRAGAVTAIVFLQLNDLKLTASNDELVEVVLGVAGGELEKADVTLFMRHYATAKNSP